MTGKNNREEGLGLLLDFEKRGGLLPVVVQEYLSNEVLMLAYANRQAFDETLRSGYATFWSTSRNELWVKGKASGDLLRMRGVLVDCDQDALVYRVEVAGRGACHTKDGIGEARRTCFYRVVASEGMLSFREGMK